MSSSTCATVPLSTPSMEYFVSIAPNLKESDIGEDLKDFLESAEINYDFSDSALDNTLFWFGFSLEEEEKGQEEEPYTPELCLLYYNCSMFIKDYASGKLQKTLKGLKSEFYNDDVKFMLALHNVGDTLFADSEVSRDEYEQFLIELTVEYEIDYIDIKNTQETYDLIQNIQSCLEKKSSKKELQMDDTYVASKGAKYSKKAGMEGLGDKLSHYYISFLMSIPNVSEKKAIAIAKQYPTFSDLMRAFEALAFDPKECKSLVSNIRVQGTMGDLGAVKFIGKTIAERIFNAVTSLDPELVIDEDKPKKTKAKN